MSRKPPKLVPIEGKSTAMTSQKVSNFMPPLKQGGNVNTSTASGSSQPRRSATTRNFLNCNGSSRRRFPSVKLQPPVSTSSKSTSTRSSVTSSIDDVLNGCVDDDALNTSIPAATSKIVNGTVSSNGNTRSKSSEPAKLTKRSRSNLQSRSSTSVNSQSRSITNGKKVVNSRNGVSTNSQNNVARVEKRTSKLKSQQPQHCVVETNSTSCASSSSSSPTSEEKNMPALVAYDVPLTDNSDKDTLQESSEAESTENETLESLTEPKIIRKGDTVIKSYVDDITGKITCFDVGMKLEVCDFGSRKWYPAKVKSIDRDAQQILVHYWNWSSRFDEWISMKSDRVRPSANTNVVRLHFDDGERVEAVWTTADSRKYPATITQVFSQDTYEVIFDDGIKMKRSTNQIFKISASSVPAPILRTSDNDKNDEVPNNRVNNAQNSRRKSTKPQRTSVVKSVSTNSVETSVSVDDPAHPPGSSRGSHFSVFDPPKEDLGKRRRTVHDYSVLVKGRVTAVKTPRRPKSDGITVSPSNYDSSFESKDEISNVATESHESTSESETSSSRRRKSGSHTPASVHLLQESHKEINKEESMSESKEELLEPSPKKRKHQTNVVSFGSNGDTDTAVSISPRRELISEEITTPSQTSTSRRAKSLGFQAAVSPFQTQTDVPKDAKLDSGFVDGSGNAVLIEQAEDGFWKCPLHNCGKNFRKDSLLKMHFKHYHPELKITCGIANVVQMAQARTAFENEHHIWQKVPIFEQSSVTESVSVSGENVMDCGSQFSSLQGADTAQPTQKRHVSKSIHLPKESSCNDKALQPVTMKPETSPSPSSPTKDVKVSPETPKALKPSSRLRLNRRRNFVVTKLGRARAGTTQVIRKTSSPKGTVRNAIATERNKKTKLSADAVSESNLSEERKNREFVIVTERVTETNYTNCNSSSAVPVLCSNKFDESQSSTENCDAESGVASTFPESDSLPVTGSRSARGRWSKSHIRRGLLSSNIRRVGSNKLQNPTALYLKKRMQFRKFMGKRGRQKRTSILSRLSSGRMRVILEALNQRSLKKRRFKATRRCRDVKVDVINCICSNKTEFGLMIQCELCLCWQHGSCFNVQSNSQLPEYYACQSCAEPQNVRFSRRYEWAESEFYKLGKLPSFPFSPSFPKEDARIIKQCTNLTANLTEVFAMIKGLKMKERICFCNSEHPQLYQWNNERPPPQQDIQRDRFRKFFKPVLRKLMQENKSDPTYSAKLRRLAEGRIKLRKYSDAVESAKSTLKKKLGCRAAAFLDYICDGVLNDMIRAKRIDDSVQIRKPMDAIKRISAEHAYSRLLRKKEEMIKAQLNDIGPFVIENKISPQNGTRTPVTTGSFFVPSPVKNEFADVINNAVRSSQQSFLTNSCISQKSSVPQTANGMKRDIQSTVRDFYEVKKFLKERRTVEDNIHVLLARMAKEFPEEWKNLMKICRGFVDERREKLQEEKLRWVSNVIVTYNSLRILLRQIYSEENVIKQRALCSDFEKTTIRLFDLFGIGLTEERLEAKKQQHPAMFKTKRIRGLETLEILGQTNLSAEERFSGSGMQKLFKSKEVHAKSITDLEEVRRETLEKPGTSTKASSENVEDAQTGPETHAEVDRPHSSIQTSLTDKTPQGSVKRSSTDFIANFMSSEMLMSTRREHDRKATDLCKEVQLVEAATIGCSIPVDENTELGLNLKFSQEHSAFSPDDSVSSGIITVPSVETITSEECKKNLVRDIILQQQQIDLYFDKIEGQVIKLCSQQRTGCDVSSMKASQLSAQRDKLLESLDLVLRLSKTVIGENDWIDNDMDLNGTSDSNTSSDSSDLDSTSDSNDDDNASNFSGTDTETADEGDGDSGDDDLLDV